MKSKATITIIAEDDGCDISIAFDPEIPQGQEAHTAATLALYATKLLKRSLVDFGAQEEEG